MTGRRLLIVISLCFIAIYEVLAINPQGLADSVGLYVQQYASVGKLSVQRIRVQNKTAKVFFSKNLSGIPFTPDIANDVHEIAKYFIFPDEDGEVLVFTDGYEISELVLSRSLPKNKRRSPYRLSKGIPLVQNTSTPNDPDRGLEGIHLVVYGSHGLFFNQSRETWMFQRARLFTTVEDLYTSSYTMPYLVPMLENAGAIVLQPRERDTQTIEVVVDERDAWQVACSSDWRFHKDGGFGHKSGDEPLYEGENPFTMGGYAKAATTNDKDKVEVFTYYPDVPKRAEYAVYVSYKSLENSTQKARYSVYHNGQLTTYNVNQRMGGGTWIYLGTFEFSTDREENKIEVSNYGKAGEVVTTDAVKVGGGMGSVARYCSPNSTVNIPSSKRFKQKESEIPFVAYADTMHAYLSDMPRYMEGARYWLQYAGIPDSVYNYTHSLNDYTDDYTSRGRWVNYLAGGSEVNPDNEGLGIPVHLSIAFHTDAGIRRNDSIIGTLMIYTNHSDNDEMTYPTGVSRLAARDFGDYIQTQIVDDVRRIYAPEWNRRMLMNASYSECRNPEMPAVILELLSHQNFADMRYGLDPRFRFTVSRAIYKGIVRFIYEQYNTTYCIQPLPVKDFGMHFTGKPHGDSICLSWKPTHDSIEATAQPQYYILYTRKDSSDWDNGVCVQDTHCIVAAQRGVRYDFRVAAANRGGISMTSETLSAYIAPEEKGRVLIINGFTRVSAPESFTIDSTYAGFYRTCGIPYGTDIAYIGEQYEFQRDKMWKSDDDAGFGSCYSDLSDKLFVGNTFAYPVMHGKVLQQLGFTYLSCSASSVDSIPTDFQLVDIIMGQQKECVLGTQKQTVSFKTFDEQLQRAVSRYAACGGKMLISGSYISSDLANNPRANAQDYQFLTEQLHSDYRTANASKSGVVAFGKKKYQLQTTISPSVLRCENAEGLTPKGAQAKVAARYADSGICAAISYNNASQLLLFGFPLECIQDFNAIYTECIHHFFPSDKQ